MATLVVDDIELQLPPTVDELVTEDGEPLESEWHRAEINRLVDSLRQHWRERSDFYAGGKRSPSTATVDLTTKKSLYERVFRTGDYYCYNPDTRQLLGWTHAGGQYQELTPNEHGRLWCGQLGLWLGAWEGEYLETGEVWLRFFDPDGNLVLTLAEAERQRAERPETELERRHARLRELGVNPDESA